MCTFALHLFNFQVTRALSLGKDGAASAAASARDEMQRKLLEAQEEHEKRLEAASMSRCVRVRISGLRQWVTVFVT